MKKFIITAALLTAAAFSGMTVSAEDKIPVDTIVEELWDNLWYGHEDDGTTFPEASYEYYLLTDWVSSNYESNDYDWTNLNRIFSSYSRYYKNLTKEWVYSDDEEGNWFITDENGETYHFELVQGEWNKIDSNGNTVEMFPPHSTLEEEETDQRASIPDGDKAEVGKEAGDGGESARVIPENADKAHEKASEWEEQVAAERVEASQAATEPAVADVAMTAIAATDAATPAQGNTGVLPYLAVGIVGVVAGAAGTYLFTSKKKNRK